MFSIISFFTSNGGVADSEDELTYPLAWAGLIWV